MQFFMIVRHPCSTQYDIRPYDPFSLKIINNRYVSVFHAKKKKNPPDRTKSFSDCRTMYVTSSKYQEEKKKVRGEVSTVSTGAPCTAYTIVAVKLRLQVSRIIDSNRF